MHKHASLNPPARLAAARNVLTKVAICLGVYAIITVGVKLYDAPRIGTAYTIQTEVFKPLTEDTPGCRMAVGAVLTVNWPLPYYAGHPSDFPLNKRPESTNIPGVLKVFNSIFGSSQMLYTDPARNAEKTPNGGFCPDGITVIYANENLREKPMFMPIPKLLRQT